MSDSERPVVMAWDILKPGRDQFQNLGAVARGVGLLLRSGLRDRLTIATLVEDHAARRPDYPALVFEGREWTYADFNAAANRYARVLSAAGIGSGDVVALLVGNRPDTLMLVVAAAKLGAAAAMCNTRQRGDALAHSLATVAPRALVVGTDLAAAFAGARDDERLAGLSLVWQLPEGEGDAAIDGATDIAAAAAGQPDDNLESSTGISNTATCFYIFTSGTTGLPKASRMSHRRWLRGGAALGMLGLRLTAEDRFYCALPLYHNNALTVSSRRALSAEAVRRPARRPAARRRVDRWPHSAGRRRSSLGT